ncbi:AAA family ATPase [Agrobacterium sp. fls2-241-TYG-188a]|uniref:AAA family ATPase n=1 Tax=Agrobacterium sp. fls2-241-TYG-188a TaxID=3040275 RepID=UPI0025518F56|nr:AAA family ATPase [Agrobacterium sp. fls2-241-TYG-188a]
MKLSSVSLRNFRGVNKLDLELDPQITVIVGRNGVGKSSILDALAILLGRIQAVWENDKTKYSFEAAVLKRSDVKFGSDDYELSLNVLLEDAIGEDFPINLDLNYSDGHFLRKSSAYEDIRKLVFDNTLLADRDRLIVYYRQDRGFDERAPASGRIEGPSSLFGSLRAISQLERWLDQRDAEEARRVRDTDPSYRDPQLQAVRALISEVDGFEGIGFSSLSDITGIYFVKDGGAKIPVASLSTGERSFIILLADLARRLQQTAPGLELRDIPAVVLIDEIDLNLHPSWQGKIIPTLARVFASCQFVITTHSPQVISSVLSEKVRILSKTVSEVEVSFPIRTKGQTSNYILEGVFDSYERYPEIDNLFVSFNNAIDENNFEKAKDILERIKFEMEGEPVEFAVLRKRLRGIEPKL